MSEPSLPPLLWHYTDVPGFKSIIQGKTLWATDCRYLNDPLEFELTRRAFYEGLGGPLDPEAVHERVRIETANGQPMSKETQDQVHTLRARALLDMVSRTSEPGPFITSYCEDGDLLSQWRGYANRRGYAIGLGPF